MKVLLIITLVCVLLNITTLCKGSSEIRKNFTNAEWKIIKERIKNKYKWYIHVMIICCPIINLFFALVLGFKINETVEEIVGEYKQLLKTE